MNRSAAVAPNRPPATVAARSGCSSQWRNTKGITTRMAAGRFFDLSGHDIIRLRFAHTPAPSEWTQARGKQAERMRR